MRPRILQRVQRFTKLVEPIARLFGRYFDDFARELLGRRPARRNDAHFRRARNAARRRIVMRLGPPRADIVRAKARVHVFEIDVLHIAGIDALISGCNRERGLRVVARLEREPLRQTKMHVALECCGMRAHEQ